MFVCSNGDLPLTIGRTPVTSDELRLIALDEIKPFAPTCAIPVVREERTTDPWRVVIPAPPRGEITMFPVVLPPKVKVLLLAVPMTPDASNESACPAAFCAEREAVGVPPATLITANFALLVAFAPRRKS